MSNDMKPQKFWIIEYAIEGGGWEIQAGVFERTKKAAQAEWSKLMGRPWCAKRERVKRLNLMPVCKGRW
jgi:hypothetical protein